MGSDLDAKIRKNSSQPIFMLSAMEKTSVYI